MINNKPTACVFDLDNTLIDSGAKLQADVQGAFERLGYQVTPEEMAKYTSWYEHAQTYGISKEVFDREFDKRKTWQESLEAGEAPIFPETYETLDKLKSRGLRLALLSKSIPEYTQTKLDFHNLSPYFEQVVTIHPKKPSKDPAAIEVIQKMDPATLKKAYFIGDRTEDVTCERAVRAHFQDYELSTAGIYINRKGQQLEGYPSIKSLEGVLELV